MEKIVMILMLGLLLITGTGYGADGDLTIMGNLGVGIDAPDSGCVQCKGQLWLKNPTRPWVSFSLSDKIHTNGYMFSIDGNDAAHYAFDNLGISFHANIGAANRETGYRMKLQSDGRVVIGNGWYPSSQLNVYGTAPLALTGTVNTDGSNTITGNGTLFTTELKKGSAIHLNNGYRGTWGEVEGRSYTISNIESDTSLTINGIPNPAIAQGITANTDSNLFAIYNDAQDFKLLVTQNGYVGIGTTNPQSKLAVTDLPTSLPGGAQNAGVLCITVNGDIWIDVNTGDGICN